MIREFVIKIFTLAARFGRRFITLHSRPVFEDQLKFSGTQNLFDEKCAIVIQGPIKHENSFTFETVKFYRRNYPSATVLLSTWNDEDVSSFKIFNDNKFKIIQSSKPYHGPCNVNMQIVTAGAGASEAYKLGLKYILKTRSDQRMYGVNCLEYLINMIDCFPVFNCSIQKKRLIATNTGTTKFRPYHFSDLFMFGDAEDMKSYWNPDLVTDQSIDPKKFLAEGYFLFEYLKKTGWKPDGTMEDFMKALGERCVVVDNESVDVFWNKYTIYREYRLKNYFDPINEINFKVWLNEAYTPASRKMLTNNNK